MAIAPTNRTAEPVTTPIPGDDAGGRHEHEVAASQTRRARRPDRRSRPRPDARRPPRGPAVAIRAAGCPAHATASGPPRDAQLRQTIDRHVGAVRVATSAETCTRPSAVTAARATWRTPSTSPSAASTSSTRSGRTNASRRSISGRPPSTRSATPATNSAPDARRIELMRRRPVRRRVGGSGSGSTMRPPTQGRAGPPTGPMRRRTAG